MRQRVRLRDETVDVESSTPAGDRILYQLRSPETGRLLTALCPPDIAEHIGGAIRCVEENRAALALRAG